MCFEDDKYLIIFLSLNYLEVNYSAFDTNDITIVAIAH